MVQRLFFAICLVLAANSSLAAGRGYLGVQFGHLPDTEKQVPAGVIVKKVFAGMAAQQAGLKPGEIVTQINGEFVADPPSAVALLARNAAGQKVRLTVIDKTGGALRRSNVVIAMGKSPTEDFAKIMRTPPPCHLSGPSMIRHCAPRAKTRHRSDYPDASTVH